MTTGMPRAHCLGRDQLLTSILAISSEFASVQPHSKNAATWVMRTIVQDVFMAVIRSLPIVSHSRETHNLQIAQFTIGVIPRIDNLGHQWG